MTYPRLAYSAKPHLTHQVIDGKPVSLVFPQARKVSSEKVRAWKLKRRIRRHYEDAVFALGGSREAVVLATLAALGVGLLLVLE